ncbi:MAG: hypothetical protein ACXWAV_05675 [Chthoniobacterales bacterium]
MIDAPETVAPPPPQRRRWSWKEFGGKFLVISIAVHLLFAAAAAVWVVQRYQATRKLTFKGGPPSPNPSTRALEHKVQMAKKQSTMSAPTLNKRITTTGLSKVTLPEMPAMPKVAAAPAKMASAGGTDSSFAMGAMTNTGGSGGGGAAVPFFGFRESRGGGSLVGKFYDLKQTKDRKPSNLDQDKGFPDELNKFVTSGWNEANLAKYFVAPNPLFTTQIFIPKMPAEQGPRAFNLGNVQPKMWVVHYKGSVIPPEGGNYRFVGMADDILVVRFNGNVVLDCGSNRPSGKTPQKYYASDGLKLDAKMDWYKGLGVGDWFQVQGGNSYGMEVLIGEWPGGDFKAWLLLEKEGAQYDKDKAGNPILPIFKLQAGDVTSSSGEAPVFAKQGPVWKAEKPKTDVSPSPSP